MPRLPIDYSKTIIYKIVCNDLNICDLYVGSTTDFIRRKGQHKSDCNNEKSKKYNRKVYQTIRQNGGWDNFSMVEIEKHPCNDSNEARTRERYYFELLNASLNTIYPNRNNKAYYEQNKNDVLKRCKIYYEANKEMVAIWGKQYREANKEKISEQRKEYREANKEIIAERKKKYSEANKEKIAEHKKQYREANKEIIAERKKKYREANKEKLKEKAKQYRESKKQNIISC